MTGSIRRRQWEKIALPALGVPATLAAQKVLANNHKLGRPGGRLIGARRRLASDRLQMMMRERVGEAAVAFAPFAAVTQELAADLQLGRLGAGAI